MEFQEEDHRIPYEFARQPTLAAPPVQVYDMRLGSATRRQVS
jgi:hypothetical protein